ASAAELGWFGLHVPEEYGGGGFGLLEQAVGAEAPGRSIAPGGYLPTVHAAALLAREGGALAKELLPGLADGSTPASVAIGAPAVEATAGPEGLTLAGVSR